MSAKGDRDEIEESRRAEGIAQNAKACGNTYAGVLEGFSEGKDVGSLAVRFCFTKFREAEIIYRSSVQ